MYAEMAPLCLSRVYQAALAHLESIIYDPFEAQRERDAPNGQNTNDGDDASDSEGTNEPQTNSH
jgi:hypothetical protein